MRIMRPESAIASVGGDEKEDSRAEELEQTFDSNVVYDLPS